MNNLLERSKILVNIKWSLEALCFKPEILHEIGPLIISKPIGEKQYNVGQFQLQQMPEALIPVKHDRVLRGEEPCQPPKTGRNKINTKWL